jgi:hypothetical protein
MEEEFVAAKLRLFPAASCLRAPRAPPLGF